MTDTLTAVERSADRDRATAVLVIAFSADPVIRWLYPDSDSYLRFFPRLVAVLGGDAFVACTAEVSPDGAGAALWVAPDAEPDETALAALFADSIDPRRGDAVAGLLDRVIDHHPAEPTWYLPFVGVDPIAQGRGIGSRLLASGVVRAERDGLPAYLEASTPRNRALYERHGFRVVGEVSSGGSPPLWPMLRAPEERRGR